MNRSIALCATGVAAAVVLLANPPAAFATVRVAAPIGDHMMVQRGRPVRLWGTAAPGEAVRAALAGGKAATQADASGRWALALPSVAAGGPFVLSIQGSNALTFSDVWSGEVWVASGQSNMEFALRRATGGDQAVAGGCPGLRLFTVAKATAGLPKPDVSGAWQVCDADTAKDFSAVAFYFGQELHRALGVPVGLIHSSWGGTPAEAWTSREALRADASLKPLIDALDRTTHDEGARAEAARKVAEWEAKSFHQDTGNLGEAKGFARAGGGGWLAMNLPQFWEDAIRVSFANVTSALVTADGAAPKGFMLAGADRTWHWADARIDGDSVVVSSPDVPEPVAVRYGWADDPPNTLRNQADLPAAPFRTDDWTASSSAPAP